MKGNIGQYELFLNNRMSKIRVHGADINIVSEGKDDLICLTDMLKSKDGEFFITDWLRNKIL